jgi:hypothetical protein
LNANSEPREKRKRRTYAERIVSDHALIRWLERAHGMDMQSFRRQLADRVRGAAQAGATSIVIDGFTFVLKDGVLVTVVPGKKISGGG